MKNVFKNDITVNFLPGLWFWGFIYFLLIQHWELVDAIFWIYVFINKHF